MVVISLGKARGDLPNGITQLYNAIVKRNNSDACKIARNLYLRLNA